MRYEPEIRIQITGNPTVLVIEWDQRGIRVIRFGGWLIGRDGGEMGARERRLREPTRCPRQHPKRRHFETERGFSKFTDYIAAVWRDLLYGLGLD